MQQRKVILVLLHMHVHMHSNCLHVHMKMQHASLLYFAKYWQLVLYIAIEYSLNTIHYSNLA